jgi:hypothetical protein
MPNWCSNALVVKGPKKDLDAFKATLNQKDVDGNEVPFSFAQTVPPPANMIRDSLSMEQMAEAKAKGIPTWYDWQSMNWGCKWDACEANVQINPKSVKIWFDTPWSPPLGWFSHFAAKFPNLTAELAYNECGMSFYGLATAENGEMSDDGGTTYPSNATDDDGNPKGCLKKHMNKYGLGMGG